MKLCRFELKAEPGRIRSGMVHAGRIYETDGAEAVAVHEAAEVRPLMPISRATSLRFVRTDLQPLAGEDEDGPRFFYGNSGALVGSSQILPFPNFAGGVTVHTYVAAVIVGHGFRVDVEDADDLILGFSLLAALVATDQEGVERRAGAGFGRSYDAGAALGPVLTTPDEMEDFLADERAGRRYGLDALLRVNGVERASGNIQNLPYTFAQAIAVASESTPIREGDVLALGPIVDLESPVFLEPNDDVQLAVQNLGTLSFKLSAD